MKKVIVAIALMAALSGASSQVMAMLVGQRFGTSVTGTAVLVCIYAVGAQRFEQAQAIGTICAPSVWVR